MRKKINSSGTLTLYRNKFIVSTGSENQCLKISIPSYNFTPYFQIPGFYCYLGRVSGWHSTIADNL
jgi:hypothetical protein